MNIFFMVNEIKMNKIWNGELIFIMKMVFCILLPKTSSSDLLNKFSNESVKTILMKMTFKEKELNRNSLPMKI